MRLSPTPLGTKGVKAYESVIYESIVGFSGLRRGFIMVEIVVAVSLGVYIDNIKPYTLYRG